MQLDTGKSGRDQYVTHYQKDRLESQAAWLREGAHQKASSVTQLLESQEVKPNTILELGCGTGAVISQLQERGVAKEYFGVDYSEDAITYLKNNSSEITTAVVDIMETPNPFGSITFDVVLLTHTLEHLEEPELFLRKISELNMTYLIVEVPLEDLFFGKIKALIIDRSKNPAGHVQFYSNRTFEKTVVASGYDIIEKIVYAPILNKKAIANLYSRRRRSKLYFKYLSEYYLPKYIPRFWKRYYHAHMAVLCRKQMY